MTVNFRLISGAYLSLAAPLEWCDIPNFTVLTGPNGSGKSQLLTLIQQTAHRQKISNVVTILEGLDCTPGDAVLVGSDWIISDSTVVNFQHIESLEQQRRQVTAQLMMPNAKSPHLNRLRFKYAEQIAAIPDDVAKLADNLPEGLTFEENTNPAVLINYLGILMRKHYLDRADLLIAGRTEAEILSIKGPPLWDVANEILAQSYLPYKIMAPDKLKIRDPYMLQIISEDTKAIITPKDLSSGERVLFSLLVALFASTKFGVCSKLLLLDEPDAHLHTSQIRAFLNMLRTTLVSKFGCHVIMTTHRPDTIVQVDPASLFEMSRVGQPRIRACESLSTLFGGITSYIVDVLPSTRCVYVEDEDDVLFYTNNKFVLSQHGLLQETPSLTFCSASLGEGKSKRAGGRGPVQLSVKKLRDNGLHMVCGLIDEDGKGSTPSIEAADSIFSIERYNIENYLYDPLLVYCCLLHYNQAPKIPAIGPLNPGDESAIKTMTQSDLQTIVDVMVPIMEQNITGLSENEKQHISAELIHGQKINLPAWTYKINGHKLEALAYGINQCLTRKNLLHILLCSRIVYHDIFKVFKKIQNQAAL